MGIAAKKYLPKGKYSRQVRQQTSPKSQKTRRERHLVLELQSTEMEGASK